MRCEEYLDNVTVNVGQTEFAAVEAIRQLLVIATEQMQHAGVEIVDPNPVFDSIPS